jgi:hypothetical protein
MLGNLAVSLNQPIFWIGPKKGYTYELTQTQNGSVFIRYLPPGVQVGADKPYLTVATYPFPGAYAGLKREAGVKGAVSAKITGGGLVVLDEAYPKSVHLAYRGVNYQVEVFDPTPARAMEIVAAGRVGFFGRLHAANPSTAASASRPEAASVADLRSLASSLGHPIYWAGPKHGPTYELTLTRNGTVFIRYLPKGVNVGTPKAAYLTVATYPFPGAFAAVQRAATGNGAVSIKLPGGGLGVVDTQYPESIHLAFPGSNYQVEVFDPSPARVRQIVGSGRVRAIG